MKKFILTLVLATFSLGLFAAETKQVCHETKNQKTGKIVKECKTVKVHKKLESTKISDAKK